MLNSGLNSLSGRLTAFVLSFLCLYPFYLVNSIELSLACFLMMAVGFVRLLLKTGVVFNDPAWKRYLVFVVSLIPAVALTSNAQYGALMLAKCAVPLLLLVAGGCLWVDKQVFLKGLSLLGIPIAFLNILFWVSPETEFSFLNSSIASLFVSPDSLSSLLLYGDNNVIDPNKAGTFFVNTNNASVLFCFLLLISFWAYLKFKKKRFVLAFFLYLAAEYCTGCRTGLLALLVVLAYALVEKVRKSKNRTLSEGFLLLLFCLPIGLILACQLFPEAFARFSVEAIRNDPRFQLWQYALGHLSITGEGFDGWDHISRAMESSFFSRFPLHSHLLMVYSWGGLISLFGYCYFWLPYIFSNKTGSRIPFLVKCLSIIVLIHGMFDNYFLMNMNLEVLIFVTFGVLDSSAYMQTESASTAHSKSMRSGTLKHAKREDFFVGVSNDG